MASILERGTTVKEPPKPSASEVAGAGLAAGAGEAAGEAGAAGWAGLAVSVAGLEPPLMRPLRPRPSRLGVCDIGMELIINN